MLLVPLGLVHLRHQNQYTGLPSVLPTYSPRTPVTDTRISSAVCQAKLCGACRFTLDELEGFLETAKECIPGVKEAIVSANSHKAHRVRILCLPHLL